MRWGILEECATDDRRRIEWYGSRRAAQTALDAAELGAGSYVALTLVRSERIEVGPRRGEWSRPEEVR